MFAPCSHAPGLLAWLEHALRPLPFAMCFSAAQERPGGILALPNGFLKTVVTQLYGDELDHDAASAGLERIEIVVDPMVSAAPDEQVPPGAPDAPPPTPVREQPPGLTTRLFAERGFWQLTPLAPRPHGRAIASCSWISIRRPLRADERAPPHGRDSRASDADPVAPAAIPAGTPVASATARSRGCARGTRRSCRRARSAACRSGSSARPGGACC
jgi:hypothetical protein